MKIISLEAENVKKLKAVEIRPKDSTIVISGKNEQGKSSILDSIWLALGGKAAAKGLKKPIRDGEESAHVKIDLGDITVIRTWTSNDKSYLKVSNKDGSVFQSPQNMLNNLIGNLSFDPLAFSTMEEDKQRETLLGMVDIGIDLDELEAKRQTAYDNRTLKNRTVKDLEGQLSGLPEPDKDTPDEETSASSILGEIQKAQEVKEENDGKRRDLEKWRGNISQLEQGLDNVKLTIETLEGKLSNVIAEKEELRNRISKGKQCLMDKNKEITALIDPDISEFQEKLEKVEETNEAVREKQKRIKVQGHLSDAKSDSEQLTETIAGLDQKKDDAIKAAKFPIDALGFDETGVTYKGIPFGQCSAAERLRVSISMALAINPKLKVIRITDGSLLDSKNMKIIQDMVKDNDFQCWIERVQDSPDGASVYIEDGEIKEVS